MQCEKCSSIIVWMFVEGLALGIGEVPWAFKSKFSASQSEVSAQNVDLVFDGLDTFATVTLVSIVSHCQRCLSGSH